MSFRSSLLTAAVLGLIAVAVCGTLLLAPRDLTGEGHEWVQWRRQQRIAAGMPGLHRLYTFQDVSAAAGEFANHSGLTGRLVLERPLPERARDAFSVVEGRWPWKQAVRLRHAALHARLSVPTRRAFSFHAWFRHFGEASAEDSFHGTVCSVMSMGDGVHVGWCLQLLRPCNTLLFALGQPKGAAPIAVSSRVQVPEQLWTAVAGTWDGEELRLYVNGLLYAAVPWQGPWMPPLPHSRFRLGLAGNGSLAACIEFDEVALFDRCLQADEIVRLTWPELPADSKGLQQLLNAGERLAAGDADAAHELLQAGPGADAQHGVVSALWKLRHAEILRELQRLEESAAAWESLAADPAAPDLLRLTALPDVVRLQRNVLPRWRLQQTAVRPDQWSLCGDYAGDHSVADATRTAIQQFQTERWLTDYRVHIRPLLLQRCAACHAEDDEFTQFTVARLAEHPALANPAFVWEQAVSFIGSGQMPLQGHPQLDPADRQLLDRWWRIRPPSVFCEQIPTEDNQQHYPGYARTRRLNRLEYRNAIRDLLGVELQWDELPPADGSGGEGFDNVGDVLFTSPSHLASWMSSTETALRRALEQETSRTQADDGWLLSVADRQILAEGLPVPPAEALRPLLQRFCRRAWRRIPAAGEVDELLTLYETVAASASTGREALEIPLQAILLSPHFLFVVEPEAEGSVEVTRLTADELATRLALFLWSSIPDESLRESAESRRLLDAGELCGQLDRMLRDPRSRALGESFGVQWLGLDEAAERRPDPELFPEYTPELAACFREEAIRTMAGIFRENRALTELLSADSVWVNATLARFYGLPELSTEDWSRMSVADSQRGGAAGMAAVLTAASFARRTSPVLRGKWLLQKLLGTAVEPPPPGIPPLESANVGNQPVTMRMRLESHRSDPDCAACHEVMDPLGFSLEHFDAIGRWRTHDNGLLVDSQGILPDGTLIDGPAGLRLALLARQDEFLRHFTRRLLGYALGRGLTSIDDCLVERCLERLRADQWKARGLLEEIVLSYAFQHRYSLKSGGAR